MRSAGFLDLARRYGVYCAERAVTLFSASLHGQGQDSGLLDQTEIRKLTIGGSQICARVLVGILGTLPAVAGFAVYSGFLLHLDMTITPDRFRGNVGVIPVFIFTQRKRREFDAPAPGSEASLGPKIYVPHGFFEGRGQSANTGSPPSQEYG